MKLKSNVAISETGFVFNPLSGESFSVNYTGAALLNLLRDEVGNEELIKALGNEFVCENSILEKDIRDFIHILREYQLLEGNDKN